MLIDFNKIEEKTFPGMNNGTGTMSAKIHIGKRGKIILTRIHPSGSIGMHIQKSGDDINYVMSGKGKVVCDGHEENLTADCCHVCPKDSQHAIINTGNEDLVLLTVVVER